MRDPHEPLNPWPPPSRVRQALEWLLVTYPGFDLLRVEWQIDPADGRSAARWKGPWVLVELGQPSEQIELEPAWAVWRFAILRETGAVHRRDGNGAVSDDPIHTP